MQPGVGYNLTTGQAGITLTIDDPQLAGDPEQFRVTVIKTGSGYGVQCRKGFVLGERYRASDPWAHSSYKAEIRKYYCYPDGSKTVGPFTEAKDSPLVDLGGYVQIQPASVEGGADSWGVYVIGCASTEEPILPYLAIFADGSDADDKSDYFNGLSSQINFKHLQTLELVEVETPTGTTYLTIQGIGGLAVLNYNCIRYKVATLTFEGSTFLVEQHHLGPMSIPYPVNYQGLYTANDPAPSPPAYDTELTDWLGAWTGYTKSSSGATVEV